MISSDQRNIEKGIFASRRRITLDQAASPSGPGRLGTCGTAEFRKGTAMKRIFLPIVGLLALATVEAHALPPFLGNAGMERYEQNVAQRFDPYPSVGMGPEVVGGRPQEYLNPPPSVLQVQPRLPSGTVNRPRHGLFFRRAS
jgi:hypothetical protein